MFAHIKEAIEQIACQSSMLRFLASNCAIPPVAAGSSALDSSGDHQTCPADSPWSCSNGDSDTCCYEGSNGLFLQTQFWDYSPATGPEDKWTIHGLWSDKCSGGYRQFCNPSWEIDDAKSVLEGLGLHDLVATMSENWKNQGNSDDSLWTHEFNKHGTCMSTVNPSCYSSGTENENVGDFFKRVVSLWESLPTYDWLQSAGIEPSEDKTWSVAEFSDALLKHTDGKTVYLGCDRNNAINQLWYFFSLKGSVADGEFKNIDSVSSSSCTDGFKYLPKGSSGGGGDNGGGGGGGGNKGYLNVYEEGSSQKSGCLISDGAWFTSGTCATYRISESEGGVSVRSSKGQCGVVNNEFKCGKGVSGGDFEMDGDTLTYGGSSSWSGDSVPKSNQRVYLSPDTDNDAVVTLKFE